MRAAALLLLCSGALARIHHLTIKKDPRFAFSIETFGFQRDGVVEIRVHDISVYPEGVNHTLGFLLFPSPNDASTNAVVEDLVVNKNCALKSTADGVRVMPITADEIA
jgi:hypothetical protein